MSWARRILLRIYPADWRWRFGQDLGDLLAVTELEPLVVADLLAGAVRAWWHPLPERLCSDGPRRRAQRSRRVAVALLLAATAGVATNTALSLLPGRPAAFAPATPVARVLLTGAVQGQLELGSNAISCGPGGSAVVMRGWVDQTQVTVHLSGLAPGQHVYYPDIAPELHEGVSVRLVAPDHPPADYRAQLSYGLGTLQTAPRGSSGSFQLAPTQVSGDMGMEMLGGGMWSNAVSSNSISLNGSWACG